MSETKQVRKNICVLFGGVSPEHEVSLRSAVTVLDNLDREKFRVFPVGIRRDGRWLLHRGESWEIGDGSWELNPSNTPAFISPDPSQGLVFIEGGKLRKQRIDCVFPVLHGENGEDGSVQGLLQLARLPLVGCGVGASADCMDKAVTKLIIAPTGVRQAKYVLLYKRSWNMEGLMAALPGDFPLIVKPCRTGSSVGVSKVNSLEELEGAVNEAFKFDTKALVEEFIVGQEVEVAVLGGRPPVASACGEIAAAAGLYDYDSKYLNDSASLYIPARVSAEAAEALRSAALTVFEALGCEGLSRVDFFLDKNGEVVFNEVNTLPGFTSISMYPKLFEYSGIPTPELVERLIDLAIHKKR